MDLKEYLEQLNSAETQWGIWVDPQDPKNNWRVGQFQFDNGGVMDNKVCIGSLDRLSFGFQSEGDLVREIFTEGFTFNGYTLIDGENADAEGILEAYYTNRLDDEFQQELEAQINDLWEEESRIQAEYFVDHELPDIINDSYEV